MATATPTAPTTPALSACLLVYDIPTAARVPNPSPRLRRLGVRINLSCRVVREGDVPYALLNSMREGGVSDGAAMAAAAGRDAAPAVILADFVDDAGGDGSALRTAFTEPAARPPADPGRWPTEDAGQSGARGRSPRGSRCWSAAGRR